jgi:hypothetical protein
MAVHQSISLLPVDRHRQQAGSYNSGLPVFGDIGYLIGGPAGLT